MEKNQQTTKRIIGVSGAAGHLGGVLCRQLLERGYAVRALCYRDTKALEGLSLEIFRGDILDPASLEAFVKGCDAVIHAAAVISINGDPTGIVHKSNVEGTKNLVNAAISAGVSQFIQVSSTSAVYDLKKIPDYDETRPYKKPGSYPYDYSKAISEQYVLDVFRQGKIKGCVVRPSLILGPYDTKPSKIGQAMLDLYYGKFPMLPKGGYNFIDVRDTADAIINALDQARNAEVYLVVGDYHSMAAFAKMIDEATGKKTPELIVPFWLLFFALPFMRFWAFLTKGEALITKEMLDTLKNGHKKMNNTKAKKELGLKIRPLQETVRDYFDWIKKEGKVS